MPDTKPLRVLIADDEPLAAERLQLLLAKADGAQLVGTASDGDSAINLTEALGPDLLLLDIAMPGLDGYSVCRLLKSDAELKAIPVILMTTGASVHHRLAGLSLGADDFLSKPIDMRELILRIRVRLAG